MSDSDSDEAPPRKTTRKVIAQRKFAQGAFVPAAAVAGPSGASTSAVERRDSPCSNNDGSNIILHNVSAKGLLDVVSYNGTHSHFHPVVLLERITSEKTRAPGKSQTNEPRQVDAINGESSSNAPVKARSTKKVVKSGNKNSKGKVTKRQTTVGAQTHAMTLRSRELLIKPSWLKNAASIAGTSSEADNQSVGSLNTSSRSIKTTKTVRNTRNRKRPNFSVDDDRPLQYLVNKSTPSAPAPPVNTALMGPPRYIPPRTVNAPSGRIKSSLHSMDSEMVTQNMIPNPTGADCNEMQSIGSVGTAGANGSSKCPPKQTTPPYPFPALLQPRGYYSVQGIRRWIDSSLQSDETVAVPSTSQQDVYMPQDELMINNDLMQTEEENVELPSTSTADILGILTQPEMLNLQNKDAPLNTETPMPCIADSWHTVEEIAKASKSDFDARCLNCEKCARIQKLIHLTTLLKRQKRINWIVEDVDPEHQARSESRVDNTDHTLDGNTNLTLDMIPWHEHLVIQIIVWITNDSKKFSANVIPRPMTAQTRPFNLIEHEYLLDEVIETLKLNLGDSPLYVDKDPAEKEKDMIEREEETGYERDKDCIKPSPNIKVYDESVDKNTILEAPTFYPRSEDLQDPIAYLAKLYPAIANFGICKIVPQPRTVPTCKVDEDMRFEVTNQYISRLYTRWGAGSREMCGIKACLEAQNIPFTRPPLLEGIEINLPKLHAIVQSYGGLVNVIEKKRWGRIAEQMGLTRNPTTERKLDTIYFKYLLPVDTLSDEERAEIALRIEKAWNKRYQQLLVRASNPLHRQKFHLGLSLTEPPQDELEDMTIKDIEDCIKSGITMNLTKFRKLAGTVYDNLFGHSLVSVKDIEKEYWKQVTLAAEHIVVHSASIETRQQNLGFVTRNDGDYSEEPLNLKRISTHPSNVLKSLGPAVGVTIPTLHLGMVYSTSCWHRDPHSLPWIEYSHHGATKIWYGVSEPDGAEFRVQLKYLNPIACQTKTLWLSSDITAASPSLLRERGVKVYRVEQKPGEYILVMPRAYSSYVSTGYNVSESAYFAHERWLSYLPTAFAEVKTSCEPTMFAFEQIVKRIAEDPNSTLSILKQIKPILDNVFSSEIENRRIIGEKGIKCVIIDRDQIPENTGRGRRSTNRSSRPPVWNDRAEEECEICRCTLFLSKGLHIPSRDSRVCLHDFLRLIAAREKAERDAKEKTEEAAKKAAEEAAKGNATNGANEIVSDVDMDAVSDVETENQPQPVSLLPLGVNYTTLEVHYQFTNYELLNTMELLKSRIAKHPGN